MKKIMLIVILLVLLITSAGCSENGSAQKNTDVIKFYQEIPGVTKEEIAAIEHLKQTRKNFTYGHLLETEAFRLPDGTFAGFTIKVCALLSKLFEAEFVPTYCDEWEVLKEGLDGRDIDFTGNLTPTDERKKFYHMTEPITGRGLKLYTNAYFDKINIESDLKGCKVGFMKETVTEDAVAELRSKTSFEPVDVRNFSDAAQMLKTGEIDAFIVDGASDPKLEDYDFIQSRELFQPIYTEVSIATANPELAPIISVIDKYLNSGGNSKISQLYEEGSIEYIKHKLYHSFTDEEKAYIADLKARGAAVKIAIEHDNYPVGFYNTVDNQFQGIVVDVLAQISQLTDIRFEPAVDSNATWPEIYEKAKNGEIAMIDELMYSKERTEYFIWSTAPYVRSYYALISKEERPHLEFNQIIRAKVGTLSQSVAKNVFLETFPNHVIHTYDTQYECLDALENGEIDLLMATEHMLLMQTNYREKTGFKVNYIFNTPMESYLGFNKNEHILRSIIDKAQKYVEVDSIALNWTGRVFDYSKKISHMRTVYLSIFTGVLILALFGLSFLLYKNNRLRVNLAERTTMLSTIYASWPETIFCKNTDGIYTNCNLNFAKQAGMPESEIIGKTLAEVFQGVSPAQEDFYKKIDKRVMKECLVETFEETLIQSDGKYRILEVLKAPLIQEGNVVGLLGIGRDITERKEEKSRLERIINLANFAFTLSLDGVIIETNEYSRKYLGVKPGDNADSFYNDPGQRERIRKEAQKQGILSNVLVKFNVTNGEVHHFLSNFTFVEYEQRRAYIMWALDVEQDMVKSHLLSVAEQSFQTVLDVLPIPVRIVELESGKIVYANNSLVELLGYDSEDELCKLKITDILPKDLSDGTCSKERVNLLMKEDDNAVSVDIEYLTKTGEIIEAMVSSRQIYYKGKRSSIGIIKDLMEEKERARLLKDAAEREREANQMKTLFLSNMSHEIRTPMNSIIGMAELLMREKLSKRQTRYVKDIKTSAESLLNIINDILDLNKIGEGKFHLTPINVELNSVLKNVVSMMSFLARSKKLKFIENIELNTPEYVYVDDVRISQIVVNLISNAVKYTKAGHVKLSVRIEGENILIEVSDTGTGIKKDDIAKIFTAFERSEQHRNRAIKGTGLGLSIVKNLLELMNGKIWVESEYGAGTTFYVTIPYVPGDESAVEVAEKEFDYIFAPTAKILIVDDIQSNLTVGTGLLRMCGIIADTASSGYEAIELVEDKDYDIVFMDHMMPEMDGVEAMHRIKDMGKKYDKLPIIALTANAMNESKDFLLSSGMSDFLAKPIDKNSLMDILLKWLPAEKIKPSGQHSEDAGSKSYTKVLTAMSKIEGLDIEIALGRVGGMQEVLEEAIKQVANSISYQLEKMEAFLLVNDLRGFAIEAHGLKGALANIGATDCSEFAAELEMISKADNIFFCKEKFPLFKEELEGFAAKVKTIIPQENQVERYKGEWGFLVSKVNTAIEYLEIFDVEEALECLNELKKYTFDEETDAKLHEVKNAIEIFSYEQAISLLEKIKAEKMH